MSNAPKEPGKRQPAKAVAQPVDPPTHSDLLIDEAQLPDDAPVILEFHQLDRRRRAALVSQLNRLMPKLDDYLAKNKGRAITSDTATLTDGEAIFEFLADTEDLLASIAQDPDELRQWAQNATDQDLLALFSRFTKGFARGEASSSST